MNTTYAPHKSSSDFARPSQPAKQFESSSVANLPSHPIWIGYVFWIFGFLGAHRFFYGKPITGTIWLLTGGLLLVGWIVDLFLIPAMADEASRRYPPGRYDYSVAWLLHLFLGLFGIHRFYLGKIVSGAIWLVTGGLLGLGYIYDTVTLNETIDELNRG